MTEKGTRHYKIACIKGDGIGPEVINEAIKVTEKAAEMFGFTVEWTDLPYGARHYLETGEVLPDEALDVIEKHHALLLGAIGDPSVKPGILEQGILLKLRFHFDQYVNLRPAKSFPKVPLPVKADAVDIVVVRENTEDFYIGLGGRWNEGQGECSLDLERNSYNMTGHLKLELTPSCSAAAQVGIATEGAVRRITAYACKTARARGEDTVTLASKSNALSWIYGFWEDVSKDEAEKHGMKLQVANVDALCYHLVRDPSKWGVILTPNMFGDIVSDLLAGIAGGLGVAAGANIGDGLSMFEPVHGSAPDIAGTGKANPVAAILSAGLMLQHLGEEEASKAVEKAVRRYLEESSKELLPWEFGGQASTERVGDWIAKEIQP